MGAHQIPPDDLPRDVPPVPEGPPTDPPAPRVFSLVERRRVEQAAAWSPVELLEAFLESIRAGTVTPANLMVFFCEREPDGRLRPHTWSANISTTEAIAFCELEKQRAIEDWRA